MLRQASIPISSSTYIIMSFHRSPVMSTFEFRFPVMNLSCLPKTTGIGLFALLLKSFKCAALYGAICASKHAHPLISHQYSKYMPLNQRRNPMHACRHRSPTGKAESGRPKHSAALFPIRWDCASRRIYEPISSSPSLEVLTTYIKMPF